MKNEKEHSIAAEEKSREAAPVAFYEEYREALTTFYENSNRVKRKLLQPRSEERALEVRLCRDIDKGILQTTYYKLSEDKETYTSHILSTGNERTLCPSLHHNEAPRGTSGTAKSAFSFDTPEDLEIILSDKPSPFVAKRVYIKPKGQRILFPELKRPPVTKQLVNKAAKISQEVDGHPVTVIKYKNRSGHEKCIEIQRRRPGQNASVYFDNMDGSDFTEEKLAEHIRIFLIALRDFHNEGCVHLDIKPGNIMYDDKTGVANLIDFETSFHAYRDKDEPHYGGTRLYMSPEQKSLDFWGDLYPWQMDSKTDIYSLGHTIHQLFDKLISSGGALLLPNHLSALHFFPLIKKMKAWRSKNRPTADDALKELDQIIIQKYPELANKLGLNLAALEERLPQEKGEEMREKQKKWRIFEIAAPTLTFVGITSFWVAEFLAAALGGTALSTLIGGATLFGGITVGALLSYFVFPAIVFLIGTLSTYASIQPSQSAVENQKSRNEVRDPIPAQNKTPQPRQGNNQNPVDASSFYAAQNPSSKKTSVAKSSSPQTAETIENSPDSPRK